jgi:hypothetical protein
LSVNQSFFNVSTSSFVTITTHQSHVRGSLLYSIQLTSNIIICQAALASPLPPGRQGEYSQLRYASSGANCFQSLLISQCLERSFISHNMPVSLQAKGRSQRTKGSRAPRRVESSLFPRKYIQQRGIRTESPKCLLTLPLKGWKPPSRTIFFFPPQLQGVPLGLDVGCEAVVRSGVSPRPTSQCS